MKRALFILAIMTMSFWSAAQSQSNVAVIIIDENLSFRPTMLINIPGKEIETVKLPTKIDEEREFISNKISEVFGQLHSDGWKLQSANGEGTRLIYTFIRE